MTINLYNNYNKEISFDYLKIIKDLETYDSDKEINLILVDSEEIHKINKEYRNKDYVTDVISFEAERDEFDMDEDSDYAGDIFLCIDKVYEQALNYGHSVEREFAFLLCHGILHLHGYDHISHDEEEEMFKAQDEILNKLGYKREKHE